VSICPFLNMEVVKDIAAHCNFLFQIQI
jgi:hypothetical protein